ncbi:hypothetical protein BW730_07850 [Tessaracoccus aquimaris]|uniref:Cell division protein FtsL n=1 Tax=Tessaracoccus aquimaris TaxID=1332264 RepID=A0A1Q2CMT3_9ACTN|nr:hypothetical protein [Tessaracoccus aquimaris]AQP47423.1 hypothetical protein BW730_07850 [Tessaracoccus aquimaris]
MSAATVETEAQERAPRLSLVHTPTASVSTFGFIAIIAVLIGIGLGAVMIVSTSVGAQSQELTMLRREATELGYKAESLEGELQRVSSANALALRATELGMVPNPYPAFINLADGTVTGVPTAVKGNEMPFLTGTQMKPLPSAQPTAPPVDPAPDAQAEQEAPTDITAAGPAGEEQP